MKGLGLVAVACLLVACGQGVKPVLVAPVAEEPVIEEPRLPLTLPEDLLLPHEAQAHRVGYGDQLYNYVCLDPPPALRDAPPDDGRAVGLDDLDGEGGYTIERIALYRDEEVAAEAMSDLRAELALCADGLDHVGNPYGYRTLPQPELPRAHETLQWHTESLEAPEAFVTVMRLGPVLYLVDHRTEADLDDEKALWREVLRAQKALGSFALELCLHGYGRGCQEEPS